MTRATLVLVMGFAVNAWAHAQVAPASDTAHRYRARLLGVYDEASVQPLAGVRVLDVLNGNSALTTNTGTVSLAFLPDGGSLVRIQHIGYQTQTFTVKISPADTTPLTIMLSPAVQLPTVVTRDSAMKYISPNLRGFEERRRIDATGYFIDQAYLRKNEGRLLGDLVRGKLPSAVVAEGPHSSIMLVHSQRCTNGGPPQVYLDGVPLAADVPPPPAGGAARRGKDPDHVPFDLSQFQVSDLAGIEWYPSTDLVPIEFSSTSRRCGALLLWTREK